jgi:hypothetical protein
MTFAESTVKTLRSDWEPAFALINTGRVHLRRSRQKDNRNNCPFK